MKTMTDAEMKAAFEGFWNTLTNTLPEMSLETFILIRTQTFAAFKAGHELK